LLQKIGQIGKDLESQREHHERAPTINIMHDAYPHHVRKVAMFQFLKRGVLLTLILAAPVVAADLSYTFHYTGKPESPLIVDLRFPVDSSGPRQLLLPDQYGGQKEMWRSISDLEVLEGPAELEPGDLPSVRVIQAKGKGLCHVRYAVHGVAGKLEQNVYYWPVLRGEYLHLLGKTFLVRPNWPELQHVSVELNWQLPENWTSANSFGLGERAQKISASLFELEQGVYVGGDYRFRRFEIRGKPGAIALRGDWGFTDEEFATFVRRIVTAERAFWDDDSFPFYFVTLLPVDLSPGSFAGVGRWDGFAAFMPPGTKLDFSIRYLLSHELFHTWNPTRLSHSPGVPPALYWFSEGFTDYYAYLLLMQEGYETFPDYLDRMNLIIARYWSWATRNMPNEMAAREYYTNPEAQKIAYLRGLLVALNWNAAIREATHGKSSLNDLMRALKRHADEKQEVFTQPLLIAEAKRWGVSNADQEVLSWIEHGDTVEVRKDSFGPCAILSSKTGEAPRFRMTSGPDLHACDGWFR
jgi:predicted metalloprotease with PDZ domain